MSFDCTSTHPAAPFFRKCTSLIEYVYVITYVHLRNSFVENMWTLFAAFMTLALTLLHTFWGVVFFDGCEKSRWWVIGVVVALHLLVSGLVS